MIPTEMYVFGLIPLDEMFPIPPAGRLRFAHDRQETGPRSLVCDACAQPRPPNPGLKATRLLYIFSIHLTIPICLSGPWILMHATCETGLVRGQCGAGFPNGERSGVHGCIPNKRIAYPGAFFETSFADAVVGAVTVAVAVAGVDAVFLVLFLFI